MPLTLTNWFLAILPVLVLVTGILVFKWETAKVGAISWLVAIADGYFFFGSDFRLMALANSKGMSLSLFVLLIIWGAVFMYNIADGAGAIKVIGKKIAGISDDQRIQVLLLAWCFAPVLQGLAGFGIPVAVVAPIMVVMGFQPVVAVATCLIGHSWSISFGSMASSYNSLQLVTNIPGELIGPWMAIIFSAAIFATGFGVAHIYGGWNAVKKSVPQILTTGSMMSFVLWLTVTIGTPQLATLMAGLAGCAVMMAWALLGKKKTGKAEEKTATEKQKMSFTVAFSPYYAMILISILTQLKPIKTALASYNWGLNYPEVQTAVGYVVTATSKYSKILFFSHPAPILIFSGLLGYVIYVLKTGANPSILK
ncbi:MAG TPA: L-lactate permease, partial [Bacillota bacterium]|nr:L-lactate permease [Bacillota bacterium]